MSDPHLLVPNELNERYILIAFYPAVYSDQTVIGPAVIGLQPSLWTGLDYPS
jgi:hypothetical protein